VPLAQYAAYMSALRAQTREVYRERVTKAFTHLIVEPDMVDQLGPAIAQGKAMFLYGPPGNGKSVMGEAIGSVLGGDIYVPHAIDVDGQVITLYDPVAHHAQHDSNQNSIIRQDTEIDGRWIRVSRPVITVGGELTLEMLDLRYRELSAFYESPVHLKSNGGVLVVDDFGRQRVPARDLLNRWIVPLESRVDFLTLKTGQKFELPFLVMVVFATNIRPSELVDEAFLRRIHYKILAESPTQDDFIEIFERVCREKQVAFDHGLVRALLELYFKPRGIALRGCQPRDLIGQSLARAAYLGEPRHLTLDLLEAACASYFVDEDAQLPA